MLVFQLRFRRGPRSASRPKGGGGFNSAPVLSRPRRAAGQIFRWSDGRRAPTFGKSVTAGAPAGGSSNRAVWRDFADSSVYVNSASRACLSFGASKPEEKGGSRGGATVRQSGGGHGGLLEDSRQIKLPRERGNLRADRRGASPGGQPPASLLPDSGGYLSNHLRSMRKVVARPALAMAVVSGISFGQTATQFWALPQI